MREEGVEGAGGPGQADVGDDLVFGGEPRQEDLLLTALLRPVLRHELLAGVVCISGPELGD